MPVSLLDGNTRITVKDSDLPGVENGDPSTTYTVRQILPSQSKAIAKKHTKNRANGERVDQVELIEDLLDAALVGWTGILLEGVPAECSRENKLLLDGPRRMAILSVAGLNRTDPEVRAESFRPPA